MATASDDPAGQEGCRQRTGPHFSGNCSDDADAAPKSEDQINTASGWEEEAAEETSDEVRVLDAAEAAEYKRFMFPVALASDCLRGEGKVEEVSSDEDQDTDQPEDLTVMDKIKDPSKMFSDAQEYEKWKNRGWRAVQCCGGALLVLALIFDEMD